MAAFLALPALALTALAGVLGGPPAPASGATPAPPVVDIATYNIQYEISNSVTTSDVQKLAAAGADVIGLQEMGSRSRRDHLAARMVTCGGCAFDGYLPNGAGIGAVPILFRKDTFELLDSGSQKVSDATFVGESGAGPSTISPKFLNYVHLLHRDTGVDLYVINSHAVASVQASDGGPNYKHAARLKLLRQHMDGMRTLIDRLQATGAPVVTMGDWNVNYRRDVVLRPEMFPYRNLDMVGVHASYKHLGMPAIGTHGGGTRLIDYVAANDTTKLVPVRQRILTGYRSDHKPVVVSYTVDGLPGSPGTVQAVAAERAATVSWTPAPDNGVPISGYTVTVVQTGEQLVVPGTVTDAVVGGLRKGTKYTFTVQAHNRNGAGPTSAATRPVVPFVVTPDTAITAGPRDGSYLTRNDVTWGFSATVDGASFRCTLDGRPTSCETGSTKLSALAPGTHRFTVAARDADGDLDPSPAVRTWTVPFDSSALGHTASWSTGTGYGYYEASYVQSRKRGGVVAKQVSGMRSLALVATRAPRHGTVKVYLGSRFLRKVVLRSSTVQRSRVIPVATFRSPQSGKVRVVVVSTNRPVRIEGLGVRTG